MVPKHLVLLPLLLPPLLQPLLPILPLLLAPPALLLLTVPLLVPLLTIADKVFAIACATASADATSTRDVIGSLHHCDDARGIASAAAGIGFGAGLCGASRRVCRLPPGRRPPRVSDLSPLRAPPGLHLRAVHLELLDPLVALLHEHPRQEGLRPGRAEPPHVQLLTAHNVEAAIVRGPQEVAALVNKRPHFVVTRGKDAIVFNASHDYRQA